MTTDTHTTKDKAHENEGEEASFNPQRYPGSRGGGERETERQRGVERKTESGAKLPTFAHRNKTLDTKSEN